MIHERDFPTSYITRSIAKSLGALAPCEKLFALSKEHPVISKVVEDRTALEACISFAKDHRILVEPACGAALSAVYAQLLTEDDLIDQNDQVRCNTEHFIFSFCDPQPLVLWCGFGNCCVEELQWASLLCLTTSPGIKVSPIHLR